MQKKTPAAGGSWKSPLTTERIVSAAISLAEPRLDGDDVYWLEGRPLEGGRQVIVRQSADGEIDDLLPAPFSARNRVHEYGGGAYTVHDGTVYFCNDRDAGIYRVSGGHKPTALFHETGLRFADLVVDASGQSLFCVCEDHRQPGHEPVNSLVCFDLRQPGKGYRPIAEGDDFYSSPAVSPDGSMLAWISWSHPDMPWDWTRLWLADLLESGEIANSRCLLDDGSSIFQPTWSPDNRLYFSSDRDHGWWNIHRWQDEQPINLCPMEAEFALPQWQFGMSTSAFLSAEQMLVAYTSNGGWSIGLLCTSTGELQRLKSDQSRFSAIHAANYRAVMLASSPTELPGVFLYQDRSLMRLSPPSRLSVTAGDIAIGEAVSFPVNEHDQAHGFFYAPKNSRQKLLPEELPPLIVIGHGGPTAATSDAYNVKVQFWTTRGFAVLDVNYRGSTGYGRDYRQSLNGQWGVADVEDCVAGARYLADNGRVDHNRLIIRGSSAGGFTTLCALTFHDVFKAGASLYGIGDLETLAQDTHKFEARYLDRLVGPYPQSRDLYRQRSPIHHVDQLKCPVIFLQGLQDKVVPPSQAEAMVEALQQKGIMVEYVTFTDEQHGFRNSETIQRAFEAELGFYGRVFGFTPAEG